MCLIKIRDQAKINFFNNIQREKSSIHAYTSHLSDVHAWMYYNFICLSVLINLKFKFY